MSAIGLRVGPFEITRSAVVPEPGRWFVARRSGITRKRPEVVLVKLPTEDESLLAEVQRLDRLDDPRIPKLVAFYEGSGAMAIDAPLGTTLTTLVTSRRDQLEMTPATVLDLALELVEAVHHANTRGIVHGHLAPDNIALSASGDLTVWGLGPDPSSPTSPQWVAPERERGEPAGPKTDQWSIGAIIAALITGHPPWRTTSAARRGDVDPAVTPVETQWPALGRLIRRMIDPNPLNRFDDLRPVRQELLALARRAGGTSDRRAFGARFAAPSPTPPPESPMPNSLPSEPLDTVRPEITSDVPVAMVGDITPPTVMRVLAPMTSATPPTVVRKVAPLLYSPKTKPKPRPRLSAGAVDFEDTSDEGTEQTEDPLTWEPEPTDDPRTWEPDGVPKPIEVEVELDEEALEAIADGPFRVPTDIDMLPPDAQQIGRTAEAETPLDAPVRGQFVRSVAPITPPAPTAVPMSDSGEATSAEVTPAAPSRVTDSPRQPNLEHQQVLPEKPVVKGPKSDNATILLVAPIIALMAVALIVIYTLWMVL